MKNSSSDPTWVRYEEEIHTSEYEAYLVQCTEEQGLGKPAVERRKK